MLRSTVQTLLNEIPMIPERPYLLQKMNPEASTQSVDTLTLDELYLDVPPGSENCFILEETQTECLARLAELKHYQSLYNEEEDVYEIEGQCYNTVEEYVWDIQSGWFYCDDTAIPLKNVLDGIRSHALYDVANQCFVSVENIESYTIFCDQFVDINHNAAYEVIASLVKTHEATDRRGALYETAAGECYEECPNGILQVYDPDAQTTIKAYYQVPHFFDLAIICNIRQALFTSHLNRFELRYYEQLSKKQCLAQLTSARGEGYLFFVEMENGLLFEIESEADINALTNPNDESLCRVS